MMSHRLQSPRIGSVTVRHSRIQLKEQNGSGDDRDNTQFLNGKESPVPNRASPGISDNEADAEDQNWSLVDLLSRSASAQTLRRPRSTKPAFLLSYNQHRRHSKPDTAKHKNTSSAHLRPVAKNGGARLWRRPNLTLDRDYPLNESHEDSDIEDTCDGSEYYCPISSGSSISWADDAAEAEQSDSLAKLWYEVEVACAGGHRPSKMSNEVFEECLLWQRAFPIEASSSNRFESMEEYLAKFEDEDEDLTPTNDMKSFPEHFDNDLVLSMRLRHSALDQRRNSKRGMNKTTEFVTSWLSKCNLQGESDREEESQEGLSAWSNQGSPEVERSESGNEATTPSPPPRRSEGPVRNERFLEMPQPTFKLNCHSRLYTPKCSSSRLPRRPSTSRDPVVAAAKPQPETEFAENAILEGSKDQDVEDDKCRERPGPLTFQIPHEDKVIGRQNSSKPFLLWVFDRISPT